MARIGAMVGSDVPFFFGTGSSVVRGRGEIVEHIDLPLGYIVFIVIPNAPVSTREVYDKLKIGLTNRSTGDRFSISSNIRTLADLSGLGYNDLEVVAERCCPEIREVRDTLVSRGFERVSMSGSGSAVFALIPISGSEEYERMRRSEWGDWRTFIARPILLSKG
jgi:4-diphosphocytidyl-2-C-methyl-D-erythritol kinase